MARTAVLIPAHDEEERIGATVSAAIGLPTVSEVIVIDDASTDDTASRAENAGARVVRLKENVGKGGALDAGLTEARDPDVLLLLDGDLGKTARHGELLLHPILTDRADMTIACFSPPSGKGGFGLVKGLARWGITRLGGDFDARAPLSGQRALSRAAIDACTPFAFGYGVEVALTIRALRAGLRVAEVETAMAHAATGRDLAGFIHRGRQFVHVALALARLAFERR